MSDICFQSALNNADATSKVAFFAVRRKSFIPWKPINIFLFDAPPQIKLMLFQTGYFLCTNSFCFWAHVRSRTIPSRIILHSFGCSFIFTAFQSSSLSQPHTHTTSTIDKDRRPLIWSPFLAVFFSISSNTLWQLPVQYTKWKWNNSGNKSKYGGPPVQWPIESIRWNIKNETGKIVPKFNGTRAKKWLVRVAQRERAWPFSAWK